MASEDTPVKLDASDTGLLSIPETSVSENIKQASNEEGSEDDENGGRILEQNPPPRPHKISQRKRQDHAAFDLWYEKHRDQVSKSTKKLPQDEESMPAALLFHEFEGTKIIESPRDYQLELFELAKQKNVIAVLDTGSGKTLIAALLLRHIIAQEFEDRSNGKEKRVSFFLVDKVALVYQQYAVLECNLDQPMEKFCGEMVDSRMHSKSFWDGVLDKNMVIVCTAAILQKCLHQSYIRMGQINLLIFDEAHHTKKGHPYARIIKDFYPSSDDTCRRPKIFGMTASPVDAQTNISRAARELEGLLHSTIATVADPAVLQKTVCKPKQETIVLYQPGFHTQRTELTNKLHQLVGRHSFLSKQFAFAEVARVQLGPWCVDQFWKTVFKADEIPKLQAKAERDWFKMVGSGPGIDDYVGAVPDAGRLVSEHSFAPPARGLLSHKVQRLRESLLEYFSRQDGNTTRCIVFAEQRYTVMMLANLFQQSEIKIPNLSASALVGSEGVDVGMSSMRHQLIILSKFKRGALNCLFATSVAEEGLDIPDCNLIVRFDLYRTMIQYIQSRGRARRGDSVYIHMIQEGEREHFRKVAANKRNKDDLRKFCESLPEDRKLWGNNYNMAYFLKQEKRHRRWVHPTTKALLTYSSSLGILAEFVSSLPGAADTSVTAEYTMTNVTEGWRCEVLLPATSPVRAVIGRPEANKGIAKCSVAFDMCLELVKGGYVDENLKSTFTKELPKMRNARLAISSKKKGRYERRVKPGLWSVLGTPTELFATVLRLLDPGAMYHASRPLLLLTRRPIPSTAKFPLFFGKNRSSEVECIPITKPITTNAEILEGLTEFSLRIFDDVFSKEYEATAADLPYFLAPSVMKHSFAYGGSAVEVSELIDWATLSHIKATKKIAYDGKEPDDFFKAKYVTDLYDGSRKFFIRHVRRDLRPQDLVPEGVPPPRFRDWVQGAVPHDILNYSVSLWSKARALRTLNMDQPVVEAELIPLRRNLLDDSVVGEKTRPEMCLLVLEMLQISALPVEMAAMAYTFPAIIHRLESTLIATEASQILGLPEIRSDLALEALTKDCDNSGDHDEAPINFQAGMGRNYERLELLGDSFLKMATTISIFTLAPDKNEFEYHVERMCLISNKNLFNVALDLRLEEYIRSVEFNRRSWYPPSVPVADLPDGERKPGLVLKRGKRNADRSDHVLGDKSIADVCEAFIGAAYLTTYDNKSFDLAVRAVTAVVGHKNHTMTAYADYYAAYTAPAWQVTASSPVNIDLVAQIKAETGYEFRHPRLLRCAFMHPSYPRIYENLPSYQRLEFLGDALFDMVAVDFIFHRYPTKDPQWLTEHKMAMVSNQFLGALSASLGFHKHLAILNGEMQSRVRDWVLEATAAREQAQEDAVRAGRTPADFARDYWVHIPAPPKCLPDILEAYLGAVFVDSAYDFSKVQDFFRVHVQPYFEDMAVYDTFANKHPVTFAANLLAHKFHCRDWRAVVQETDDDDQVGFSGVVMGTQVASGFMVHGKVLGCGVAASGRYAKLSAAKQALAKLESLSLEEFRALTDCDCEMTDEDDGSGGVGGGGGDGGEADDRATAI